jgi:hypothetical protein
MAYNMSVFAKQLSVGHASDGSWVGARGLRDGALITAPWIQALVFEGKVFGVQAGSITTPIAGHAAIDADQPEIAVRVPSGLAVLPLSARMAMETGATTLAQGGMMVAVSNIDVGAGTSTSATPFNLNMNTPAATSCTAAVAYTGNGTDPLTAGNFLELARVSAVIDADAATSGIIPPVLHWSALNDIAPLITQIGSFLGYGEAAANTVYATLLWAEFDHSDFA